MFKIKDIEDTIFKINNEFYDQNNKLAEENIINLDVLTNGYSIGIKFLGTYIWCSEDDDRQFDNDTQDYIDLELHLRMKINEIIKQISTIKI